MRDYYKYTPPEVLEDILKEILGNESLDAGTRFSCLEVLLKNNVKKLETGMFPQYYYERIIEVIASQGSGLQHLNLKGVWLKDNPELLCLALNQMDQLRILHIPHIADDTVLQCVANISLKVLNISGECLFSKQGLDMFCQTLKDNKSLLNVLDIGSVGEENISYETISDLIEALPQLATLSSYSYVGKSLLNIHQKNNKFTCNLKYIHDTKTTTETCDAILKTCPHLENLYIDTPDNGVVELLSGFDNLNTLKLAKFECHELHKLLERWGENLHTIRVSLGRGILDVSKLSKSCPNLTKIEFYKMEFISHTTDLPIHKLQHLEVLYSELTPVCLRYILARSPELRKIVVGDEIGITDGDLYRLCADYCMLSLEEVWFSNARYLTVNAVELLMRHCPALRLLGRLSGWNLTSNDTDFMRAVIQSTNSDLTLLPVELFI